MSAEPENGGPGEGAGGPRTQNGENGEYGEYGVRAVQAQIRSSCAEAVEDMDFGKIMLLSSRVMSPVPAPLATAEPSGEAGSERSESSENRVTRSFGENADLADSEGSVLFLFPEFTRRYMKFFHECRAEASRTGEAAHHCDLLDPETGVP